MKKILLITSIFLLVACKSEEVKKDFSKISEQKNIVVTGVNSFAASEQSLNTVQPFFDLSSGLIAELLDQENPADAAVKLYQVMQPQDFCRNIILPKWVWSQMNQKCVSPNGYLCSDEIKMIPAIYKKLFALSPAEIQTQFKAIEVCKDWIE